MLKDQSGHSVMKGDFVSNLPRSGIGPPFEVDLSKATGLIGGKKEYYERQFAILKSFEDVDSLEEPKAEEQDMHELAQHERAMDISNWANIFLLSLSINGGVEVL